MASSITIQSINNVEGFAVFTLGTIPESLTIGSEIYLIYNGESVFVTDISENTFTIDTSYPDGVINEDNPLALGIVGKKPENTFCLYGLTANTPLTYIEYDKAYDVTFYDTFTNVFAIGGEKGGNAFELSEGTQINISNGEQTAIIVYDGPNKLLSLGEQAFDIVEASVVFSEYIPPLPPRGYPPKTYTWQQYMELLLEEKWPYSSLETNRIYYLPKIIDTRFMDKDPTQYEYELKIELYAPNVDADLRSEPLVSIPTTLTTQGRLIFLKENLQSTPIEKEFEVYGYLKEDNTPVIVPSEMDNVEFINLPIGTVLNWISKTKSYSVSTVENLYEVDEKGETYIGTSVDFGEEEPSFPEEEEIFTVQTTITETKYRKYTFIGRDINNNLILNQAYDPVDYDVDDFIVTTSLKEEE